MQPGINAGHYSGRGALGFGKPAGKIAKERTKCFASLLSCCLPLWIVLACKCQFHRYCQGIGGLNEALSPFKTLCGQPCIAHLLTSFCDYSTARSSVVLTEAGDPP